MRHSTLSGSLAVAISSILLSACGAAEDPQPSAEQAAVAAPSTQATRVAAPDHLVDLTHGFGQDTIYWPTDVDGFDLEILSAGHTEAGYYYAANRFSSAEHGGTHIDAPIHFAEGKPTVDRIPLNRLVAPGVVIDATGPASTNRDYEVGVSDFEAWETTHGRLPDGAIVLLRTGYSQHWGDPERYLGTAKTGPEAIPELHFPGLAPAAAEWLVAERKIAAIGLDTPSIDRGQSSLFESHVTLFKAEIPAFENVASLDQLPPKDFMVVALPMKIEGGSGAPLRIIAYW